MLAPRGGSLAVRPQLASVLLKRDSIRLAQAWENEDVPK